ncbi:MAG: hypothetical protein ACYCT7_06360 [bacterium]
MGGEKLNIFPRLTDKKNRLAYCCITVIQHTEAGAEINLIF